MKRKIREMFCKSPQWKISLQEPQDIVKSK